MHVINFIIKAEATQTNKEMAQNIKFKIKEFEWFEMETKVRQIIQEVLGPLQKRILENSSVLNRVKYNQGEDEKKIKQITLMIENDPKVFQTGIFASVDRKFELQEKKIQELARQIEEENKYVDQKFKILDIRMQESSEVLQNVASLRERVSKEIEIQNENINTVRANIEQMINDLNSDIRMTRKNQQDNLEACEKADYKLAENIFKSQQDIKHIKEILESHKELHREEAYKLELHSEELKHHAEEIDVLQESKTMTKKLSDYVKDLENQLRMVQFKLEAVSPLVTQAQISDCLYHVLPQKMKKRIAIHQHKKYSKLNQEVLEKPYKEVDRRFKGLQLLEEMQKRNTKEIVQMKRKKLLAMGIDIDHLTYEQRERYYKEMVLEEVIEDDDEEVKVTAKVDQKEVLQVVNKYFTDFTNSIKQKVSIELEDSKKYLYEFEEEMRHEISQFDQKIQLVGRAVQTYQTDQLLVNKSNHEQFREISRRFEELKADSQKNHEIMRAYYNFCSLLNHLSIQDEIDKQNISLMGVAENSPESQIGKRNSIVQLDKKCFSCCGFPASTLSAFKMACLAYNPSSISIDTKEYRREELLGITTSLLQKIKKHFSLTDARVLFSNNHLSDSQVSDENSPEVNPEGDKIFSNEEIKERVNDTDNDLTAKRGSTAVKFRKSKKMMGNSTATRNSRSIGRNSGSREDVMLSTSLFSELKKKNLSFLN